MMPAAHAQKVAHMGLANVELNSEMTWLDFSHLLTLIRHPLFGRPQDDQ
jgi:hypothetical protein